MLYRSNTVTHKIQSNSIFDFTIDIDRAMISIARNKAVGYDLIPGEMYKDLNARGTEIQTH